MEHPTNAKHAYIEIIEEIKDKIPTAKLVGGITGKKPRFGFHPKNMSYDEVVIRERKRYQQTVGKIVDLDNVTRPSDIDIAVPENSKYFREAEKLAERIFKKKKIYVHVHDEGFVDTPEVSPQKVIKKLKND